MEVSDRKRAVGEAHGKLILVGEHAVVYNKPAIAMPFPLRIRAIVTEQIGEIRVSSNVYTGNLKDMPDKFMGLAQTIYRSLEICHQPKEGIHIEVESEIPMGRGLGSSATAATAIVRGIFAFYQRPLSEEQLYSLVEIGENYAHGKPSGIDMMAAANEKPIFYQKTKGASFLASPKPLYIVAADSGEVGDTKTAVEHVKELRQQRPDVIDPIIDEIEDIVWKAKEAIISGDSLLLGSLLTRNHENLKKLEVSNSMLDHLVEAAIRAGALGAKLTGGGMGGCIIALTKDMTHAEKVGKALVKEGARKVWYFSTDSKEAITVEG
ncbi:MAG: mevalonate kinase [Clostridiaceae bacterium]|nr:mevalonate kinase [Clostridiaceae bacterium]